MLGMELFRNEADKIVQTTISVESRMIESTRSSNWMNNGEALSKRWKRVEEREIKRLGA